LNQETEDLFARWAESASYDGRQHFYELQELAERQRHEAGEFLFITHTDREKIVPLSLQVIEPDQLDASARPSAKGREVSGGIEFETKTRRPVFYHLREDGFRHKTYRVPAARVIHGFDVLRPGQLRGISPFAPGVLLAHELSEYMGAEIDGAKMAAKWLAMVTRTDGLPGATDFSGNSLTETGDPIESIENGIIEYLRPGESVELAKNPRPGNTFEPFVRLILSMFSVVTGAPYELISGDYSGMNYTTIRAARNDFSQFLRPKHGRHIRGLAVPVGRRFAEAASFSGRIVYPGFERDPWPFLRHEWQPPGMSPVDPLKESNAARNDMGAGLRSPQEIARSRGRNLEDVYTEISAAQRMAEEMGLAFEVGSTAAQTNPAALMEEDEE
jgi:lambda family phage portal protein